MIILSNCLTDRTDEGALKVAVSLAKRLKKAYHRTTVISYGRSSPLSDVHLSLNKLLLSGRLRKLLRESNEPVLFIPATGRMLLTALRILILSRYAPGRVRAVLSMRLATGWLSKALLWAGGAEIYAVSRESWNFYRAFLGCHAHYLKTGVDTRRFCPVSVEEKAVLRKKYAIPADCPVVLHVGHLKTGRNLGALLKLEKDIHLLLVVSTETADEQDPTLRELISKRENTTLIDSYQPRIQELYQLADGYVFPVTDESNCIDVPLSALEAASCGLPVVTTAFGELKELLDKEGFYRLDTLEPSALTERVRQALTEEKNPRAAVAEYDWDRAIRQFTTS